MIVSDSKKFVFVHIPKTGGTSVTRVLCPYSNCRVPDGKRGGKGWQGYVHVGGMHSVYCPEFLSNPNKYFKFSVVREPLDWAVSMFCAGMYGHGCKTFDEFVSKVFLVRRPLQSSWVCVGGKVAMDYLIRFEEYEAGLLKVLGRLGISVEKIPHSLRSKRGRVGVVSKWAVESVRKACRRDYKIFGY